MRDNAAMSGYTWVDDPASLEALVRDLQGQPRLGVDTEFVRENSFYARLCLVQVCADGEVACVDVQTLGRPGALGELLAEPSVTKVFHAARQDVEVLFETGGRVPAPLRDTQLAAALLGLPDQVGYAQLVDRELGVHLAKGHARTDWSRRPLSDEQLRYAAADVMWLLPLAERLENALEQLGRRQWAVDESAMLCNPDLYAFDAAGAWRRVKGAGQVQGAMLGRVAALAYWREEEARRRNRPRRWILKDEAVMALAERNPDGQAALAASGVLPPAVLQRHGEILLTVLRDATEAEPPGRTAPLRLEPAQDRVARRLMARLRELAEQHRVSAPLLATRKDVEALVMGRRDLPLLSGWRRELAGEEILDLLDAA